MKHQLKGGGFRNSEKKEVEKEEEEKEETVKHRRNLWRTKRKEQFASFLVPERREEDLKKKGRERNKSPRTKQVLGRSGRWLLVQCRCGSKEAGAKRGSRSAGNHYRVGCGGRHFREPGWQKTSEGAEGRKYQREQKLSKGVGPNEMRKEEKNLRCALFSGSTWSTERKYMRRYKGTFDVFFGTAHRLRKEEMEDHFNREAKEGWRFAADAARNH